MSWLPRSVAATVATLLAGGLAGCGSAGGSLVIPTAKATATAHPAAATGAPPAAPGAAYPGSANCSRTSVGSTPLTDLGQGRYHGFEGGLYPGGRNVPPKRYLDAGLAAAARVRPLAPNGVPRRSGRIVLLSIGMSNAYLEYLHFIQSTSIHLKSAGSRLVGGALSTGKLSTGNRHVTLVNGAYPNYDAERIVQNEPMYLGTIHTDLASAGVTSDQVQAVWLKEAIQNEHEPFPADARHLRRDLDAIIAMLTANFHNLHLIYISSRIYGGYAVTPISPEPYAYDSGFSVKWTVAGRMAHPGTRPWVAWGPYLWADGTHARRDGLSWTCADFEPDGTHPSVLGAEKVAQKLVGFFTGSPTTRTWFDKPRHRKHRSG